MSHWLECKIILYRGVYISFELFVPCIFSTYGMKTNWCHYFIRILPDLYMFRAHRPIFGTVRTAVHTTIGSVSVPLCSCVLYVLISPHQQIIQFLHCTLLAPTDTQVHHLLVNTVCCIGVHESYCPTNHYIWELQALWMYSLFYVLWIYTSV